MWLAERLRVRFVTALSVGAALVALLPTACSTTKDDLYPECELGEPQLKCFEPGSENFRSFGKGEPPPATPAHFDANNCQVIEEVGDGCCNAAATGPALIDGKCCYGFCTGSCC